jgi:hypothetical protein
MRFDGSGTGLWPCHYPHLLPVKLGFFFVAERRLEFRPAFQRRFE